MKELTIDKEATPLEVVSDYFSGFTLVGGRAAVKELTPLEVVGDYFSGLTLVGGKAEEK